MSADEFTDLFGEWGNRTDGTPKALKVRTLTGQGSEGPVYADEREAIGVPQVGQSRLVRSGTGNEALSTYAIYAPLPEYAGWFTLGSIVTLDDGRTPAVLAVEDMDMEGLFSYVAVSLE